MGYDRDSFLAGVAAGRNMESWPAFEGSDYLEVFSFTIDTRLGASTTDQFVLSCSPSDDGIIIDWGDDSTPEFVPRTGAGGKLHDYSVPGIYTINIHGLLRSPIPFTNRSVYIEGQLYFLDSYRHCLLSVNTPYQLDDTEGETTLNLDFFFRFCTNLQQVCGKLFSGTDTKHRSVQMQSMFYGCSSLLSVPSDLFEGLPTMPYNDYGIRQIFQQCSALRTVPSGLFDSATFADCGNVDNAFFLCSAITSPVPELWISHPNASHYRCFFGCGNAANYNDIPDDWK